MGKILKIDRSLYEVGGKTKTYHYYGRNPGWKHLSAEENEVNKKCIDGYSRILRNGKNAVFRYTPKS